nr:MAG TPA: hypothetical protein [Caudoviricetes sp.]
MLKNYVEYDSVYSSAQQATMLMAIPFVSF